MKWIPALKELKDAQATLKPYLGVTPLAPSPALSELLGREIHLKFDNKLRTGSFKERGALFFLLSMDPQARTRGVIAASAGNHALGLSFHAHKLGVPCHLVMPVSAPLVKVESCRNLGAKISFEANLAEALVKAESTAQRDGLTFVPPFDHRTIITGQGVAGLELLDQLADFDSIVIPVGGGGYAAGIASAVKAVRPDVFILGVCSEWAMSARTHASTPQPQIPPSSIADGIAVKRIGKITGPILDTHVDALVTVPESTIAKAVISFLEHERVVVEGAGAAGLAALIDDQLPARYRKPVVMVCGSNIDSNLLSRLIEHDMADRGRLLRINISLPDRPGMLHTISGIIANKGANILHVMHDRLYARIPGHVDITVVMETRNRAHGEEILNELRAAGLPTSVS